MNYERQSTNELAEAIPVWCNIGSLVWVDGCFLGGETDKLGIIVSCWLVDVENIGDEDYNTMMHNDEWLLLDIAVDGELLEQVEHFCCSEFK